jgi:hypothetical protein
MRLHHRWIATAALLAMCVVVPVAGAVSGPGANENSKFVYTEDLGTALALVLAFDEGSQKRFESIAYQLDGNASHIRFCGGQGLGTMRAFSETLTVTPNEEGRASGVFTIDSGTSDTICACGCGSGTLTVTYSEMTLTNLATGHVYRLDAFTRTFSS